MPRPRLAHAAGLRQDGVGLAVHLLEQEIQLLADFAARSSSSRPAAPAWIFSRVSSSLMSLRSASSGGFLRQALRVQPDALEQLGQPLLQARSGKPGRRRRGSPPCAPPASQMAARALQHLAPRVRRPRARGRRSAARAPRPGRRRAACSTPASGVRASVSAEHAGHAEARRSGPARPRRLNSRRASRNAAR